MAGFEVGRRRPAVVGEVEGAAELDDAVEDAAVPRYTAIGALKSSDPTGAKDGWRGAILQLRITDAALYDKAFEPPAHLSALPETVGLYLFDEGSGDVLRDSSGHGHDGKIVGATWR